jgi:hypothetical protein
MIVDIQGDLEYFTDPILLTNLEESESTALNDEEE